MIKVKMCGMKRQEDIEAANEIKPDYIGFVFAEKSRRYVTPSHAAKLRKMLSDDITAVGVFVDEKFENVAALLENGTIDIAQLHGNEDDGYIIRLKSETQKPVIKAFRIQTAEDIQTAMKSPADMILLDAGAGDGKVFDWSLLDTITRPYFLAGGLDENNISDVKLKSYLFALDVSSGIETNGYKDKKKMAAFMDAVRKEE